MRSWYYIQRVWLSRYDKTVQRIYNSLYFSIFQNYILVNIR